MAAMNKTNKRARNNDAASPRLPKKIKVVADFHAIENKRKSFVGFADLALGPKDPIHAKYTYALEDLKTDGGAKEMSRQCAAYAASYLRNYTVCGLQASFDADISWNRTIQQVLNIWDTTKLFLCCVLDKVELSSHTQKDYMYFLALRVVFDDLLVKMVTAIDAPIGTEADIGFLIAATRQAADKLDDVFHNKPNARIALGDGVLPHLSNYRDLDWGHDPTMIHGNLRQFGYTQRHDNNYCN